MRPTRFGVHGGLFYLLMLAAFFATPYSNLFFLLLSFLSLLGLSGLWSGRRNLRQVTPSFAQLEPVPSEVQVQISVVLKAPRARFGIVAELELVGGAALRGRVDLLDGLARLELRAVGLPRGIHAVRCMSLESSYPFGLFRSRRRVSAPQELVVYPSPHTILESRSAVQALDELIGRHDPIAAGDMQPAGLRDHRDEDGVRGIHWRASARRGRLVIQEWEGASGQGLEMLLDRRCSNAELEGALATVSAMVHLARTNKETLRLHSQGLSATFGEDQEPWSTALRFLAGAQPLGPGAPAPPPVSPTVARLPRELEHAG